MQMILNRNHIHAIILDMDGVLVDSEPVHIEAFRIFLNQRKIPFSEQRLRSFIGISVEANFRRIEKDFPDLLEGSVEEGIRARNNIYLDLLKKSDLQVIPGIDDVISCCIQNRVLLGLATSSPAEQVDAILPRLQGAFSGKYKSLFHAIVNGEEVRSKKPAADLYHLICRKLAVKENRAVALEDSPAGVESAKLAGLTVIGILNQYYSKEDLAKADFIIASPAEVLLMIS